MVMSIVEWLGESGAQHCGYCKNTNSRITGTPQLTTETSDETVVKNKHCHRMWAHILSVQDYQDLIDRGWRRSGKYCYKPIMNITCCPMYTIKCDSPNFKLTKSQKKILKNINKFLCSQNNSTDSIPNGSDFCEKTSLEQCNGEMEHEDCAISYSQREIIRDISSIKPLEENVVSSSREENVSKQRPEEKALNTVSNTVSKEKTSSNIKSGCGADPNKPPCKKAKQMRLQRKLEKLNASGENITMKTPKNKEKSLEDFINEIPESAKNRLKIKLVRTSPPSPEWLETSSVSYSLYFKYQMAIHKDKPEKCTEKQFQEFLVKSPFQAEEPEDGPPMGYGSFHQQYWLDNELIAVGVIDILPKCISSVYFFCDPKYSYLSLGTYGALRELEFTRKIESQHKELRYYYMGFYIHSCQKMRYKGNFHPSFLLCPETYEWFPIEDSIKKMEVSKYSRLNPNTDAIDRYSFTEDDIGNISVLIGNNYMKYSVYLYQKAREPLSSIKRYKDILDRNNLIEFGKLVGRKCCNNLIFVDK